VDRAIATFSRSNYYPAELSRTFLRKPKILRGLGETEAAADALDECVRLRWQLVLEEAKAPDALTEADFDGLLMPWLR